METKIDIRKAMRVFEYIRRHGERTDEGHRLNGLYANSDFDGYTIMLFNQNTHLNIGFHNKYHLDYKNKQALADFQDQLEAMGKKASRSSAPHHG